MSTPDVAEERPARVAVGLGSNLGERIDYLALGVRRLGEMLSDLRASRVYETDPVGREDQPTFLNLCCAGRTTLGPGRLLERMLAVEEEAGRDREAPAAGPRVLDLDLLLYGERELEEPELTIPHPRMTERGFVLVPLAEVAGSWRHPGRGRTVSELARQVRSEGVRPHTGPVPPAIRAVQSVGGDEEEDRW